MTVILIAQLACAKGCLLGLEGNGVTRLHKRIEDGITVAQRYDSTFNSIYWNGSNAATRREVNRTLDDIAWELADIIEDIQACFNLWCDEQEQIEAPITQDIIRLKFWLTQANRELQHTLAHRIYARQLQLFET